MRESKKKYASPLHFPSLVLPVLAGMHADSLSRPIFQNIPAAAEGPPIIPSHPLTFSHPARSEQARASALDRLHLRIAVHRPPEPLGQLVTIPELALLRRHSSQLPSALAANRTVSSCLGRGLCCAAAAAAVAHHGAVLGCLLAVGGEGLGERGGGRGGVHLGCVVDFWEGVRAGREYFWVEGRILGWCWWWMSRLTLGDGATAQELNHGRVLEEDSGCAHFGCVVL